MTPAPVTRQIWSPGGFRWRALGEGLAAGLLAVFLLAAPAGAQSAAATVERLVASQPFATASAFLDRDHERFVRDLIALTEIPAPPFKERARADAFLRLLREAGLTDVEMDGEGNVFGVRKGTGGNAAGSMLAVAAHLDTVFPEGTNVTVRREGTKLMAPGIGDDSRGLALILTLIRAMNAGGLQTRGDILFVGNVGEEGAGDLRGIKYLFREGRYKGRIGQFISLDTDATSTGWPIVQGALGVKRYRVTFKGPGGHSFSAFGLVNPAVAMGNAIARLGRLSVPSAPRTTFNVGIVGGGTSVNAIPTEVFMDVDLRSESPAELTRLDAAFQAIVRESVDDENRARSTASGKIDAALTVTGDRPSGETARTTPLVQLTAAAATRFGFTPGYEFASTDANIPISLGIPAIATVQGIGGNAHAPDEWTDVDPATSGRIARAVLATIVAAAGTP